MSRVESSRILLAEDDPVSFEFLAESLRGLGVGVHGAADGEAALAAARGQRFDALILDHHLPRMEGDAVLRTVRADAGAASRGAVAIATTADPDPGPHAHLREAGFAVVLLKPLDGAALRNTVHGLGIGGTGPAYDPGPALDDETGLRASGSVQALNTLRELFARELEALANEWDGLRNDALALTGRLHRLRAACGFCGAGALQSAAEKLSDAMRGATPARIEESRAEFQRALAATREALQRP